MIPVRLNDPKALKEIDKNQPLFCDTETCFLYKGIRLVQMYQAHWDSVAIFDIAVFELNHIHRMIQDCHLVFHNFVFDASCFQFDLGLKHNPFPNFDDTLLLARIGFVDKDSFSLDSVFSYVYGVDVYEQFGLDKKTMQKSFLTTKRRDGMQVPLTEEQVQYAAADVYYMPKLWEALSQYTSKAHYLVDKEFINNSLHFQTHGMPVDREKRKAYYEQTQKEIEELTAKLPEGLNVNSFLQVRKCLGVHASTRRDLLLYEANGNELAGLILKKRKALKLINFLERYDFERIKGFFAPTAISGRARCDGGDEPGTDNLLQIPRKLKSVFGFADSDPRWLVYCDYAQLELRTACCNTNEKVIEKAFRENLDLHTYTAVKMFPGLSYEEAKKDKLKRQAAKTCNFSMLYCGNPVSLKNAILVDAGVTITPEQAKEYSDAWLATYPSFKEWHENAMRKYRKGDMLCTTKMGRSFKAKLHTDICGIENQSLGADIAKLALNLLCRKERNVKVLCFIHDSIILEAPNEDEAKRLSQVLGSCMLQAWFEVIQITAIPDLPMPIEVNYGKNLGTIESEHIGWQTEGLKTEPIQFKEVEVERPAFKPHTKFLGRDILYDADTIFYIAAHENPENLEAAVQNVVEYFSNFRKLYEAKSLKLFLTHGRCFRYEIYPEYKANRDKPGVRPAILSTLRQYCIDNFSNIVYNPRFEADDLIVYAKKQNPKALLIAVDKDVLNAVPGLHYNPKSGDVVSITEERARVWPYIQAIAGDSSDNIKGVPGLGLKKALNFVNESMSEYQLWHAVVNAYKSHGLTEDDALLNMRLVNMHQYNGQDLDLYQIPYKEA